MLPTPTNDPDDVIPPRLLLFDIDGTILSTNGVGRMMLGRCFKSVLGRRVSFDGVPFAGRTDPIIARDVAAVNRVADDEIDAVVTEVLAAYADLWNSEWHRIVIDVLPGVTDLIGRLAGEGSHTLGLLTGNVRPVAYHKLRGAGLDHHFSDGAFGSDHADRNRLPEIALQRFATSSGDRFAARDVWIIGDTPHDVRCAREIGAVAVAVATGHFKRGALERAGADIVLDDLTPAVVLSLLEEGLPCGPNAT